ncbi:MAG TPA: MlaD family protein [Actinomycetota bacterium]|nr:MlaD family protein [Actinomycetota bacterium]
MRVMRFSPRTLVKVLVFTLLSVAFTGALLVKIGNLRLFAHTYTVSAEFADATGVFRGDAVKLAGVDVGRVESAHIDNGQAIVQFNVDDDVHLTKDSTVAIRWRNVLGQRFLYVYPGTGGQPLHEGDLIPMTQTDTAGDIGEFLNHLGPILRAIDADKANAFLDAVNTALVGNEGNIQSLLTDGASLASQLADMDEQIKSLISSSNTILSTYASQDQAIGSIVDNLELVSARLLDMTSDINSLLVNFSDVQEQLNKLLRDNRDNIDASLRSLKVITRTLEKNKVNLATTLCTLPIGLAGYFQTTSWGEWFNVRITQVILKDNTGGTIFTAPELDIQTSDAYAGAITGCGDQKTTVGLSGSGSSQASAKKSGSASTKQQASTHPNGFEDVGGLVRFVMGGVGG